ncbi:MAG: DUF2769 domain-containing protein [Methanomicrobiaceae archaeon]|nr:DUF2769 domain-containing protein [Methanomicrobiaceae archaeon]
MDTFMNSMYMASQMTPERATALIEQKKSMCICPTCPTYTECAKERDESLFCAMGKSFVCIREERECRCPECPVAADIGLQNKFYCREGEERAQRWSQWLVRYVDQPVQLDVTRDRPADRPE